MQNKQEKESAVDGLQLHGGCYSEVHYKSF